VNEPLLQTRLSQLAATPAAPVLVAALEGFIRTADDEAVVRINPVHLAEQLAVPTEALVELLLHARKAGLVTMEWQYICPGCGEVVERLASLTSATAHYFCQTCSADRDADLSDYIEIVFSVAPEVRRSRYHDPLSLEPPEHFFRYRFTPTGVAHDGTPVREYLRPRALACAYVEPGRTESFTFDAEPLYVSLTPGPTFFVDEARTTETRTFAFEYTGTRSKGFSANVDRGPVRVEFTNATAERCPFLIVRLDEPYGFTMGRFLSGAEVLSNQTYLDLFSAETIVAGEGLAVTRLTVLFTDLRGSTALYERIGDLKAFDLVRQHFGYLRASIRRHSGALVKTIGDAVMASFVDPLDALRAALEMQAEIARFNAGAGGELVGLKVGLHSGACLAVTLNERLDYFGQTVNIASRVQSLAEAGEIVVTDDVLAHAGADELVERHRVEPGSAELRGVAGTLAVHRIRAVPVETLV
jgi:class 3 adenylate cyclase